MSARERSSHFGVLSFTGTGHLNPLIALGQELSCRGHRVTFFEKPKIADRVRHAGLGFVPVCADPSSRLKKPEAAGAGFRSEIAMLGFNLRRIIRDAEGYLREMPPALSKAGVDALLVNEIALTGPTLAEQLHLPYFVISTSVPHNCGWNAYPFFAGYRYTTSPWSALERALLEVSALRLHGPLRHALDRLRKSAGLGAVGKMKRMYPPLAQITQLPQSLDFPETRLPENCHYTGPFVARADRPAIEFPWMRLDGRPIAYVSLGTTRNAQPAILRTIAEACRDLHVQLVISLGGRFAPEDFADLPGQPLVTALAPQLELLKRASIVITHAGSNTVFETLMEGKPMVAIPIAHDQPAIAARLARAGAARVLPVMRLSVAGVRAAVADVLHDPGYRLAAGVLQRQICATRGAERAAQIIEKSLRKYAAARHEATEADFRHRLMGPSRYSAV